MGGRFPNSRDNSSLINAGIQFSGSYPSWQNFTTKMSIKTASMTVIAWMVNGTVADITQIKDETPFPVNVSQLFKAFSAPLWINQTTPWSDDGITMAKNVSNTTLTTDNFVDDLTHTLNFFWRQ
jgi:hypothetical protein